MGETNTMSARAHAVALFSGGLDSILAARLLMEQGLTVRCLHFVTPFFGKPELIPHWEAIYGLSIEAVDVGADFVRLLRRFPEHGYGKVMNPCVDCKILMMRKAREIMTALGARLIASGEVLGQRPMSQRRDTLNIISREAGVSGLLLRPLCARHLPPTDAERSGLVDRLRLGAISGRGRQEQLELAARMNLAEIPTPAGGCRLAEKENARRYWPVLTRLTDPAPADFALANVGRQFWREDAWLSMGRNEADNAALAGLLGLEGVDGDELDGHRPFPLERTRPCCALRVCRGRLPWCVLSGRKRAPPGATAWRVPAARIVRTPCPLFVTRPPCSLPTRLGRGTTKPMWNAALSMAARHGTSGYAPRGRPAIPPAALPSRT